jgi:hypothetical protein
MRVNRICYSEGGAGREVKYSRQDQTVSVVSVRTVYFGSESNQSGKPTHRDLNVTLRAFAGGDVHVSTPGSSGRRSTCTLGDAVFI